MLARRWLINLGLIVVLGALALLVRLDLQEEIRETRLTSLSPDAIDEIELHRVGEPPVRLRRDDSGWQMLAPFTVPADGTAIQRLLPVASAELTRTLPAAGLALDALGLEPAMVRLRLNGLELRFGGTEPVDQQRYVLVGDMVHLIDDRFLPRLMTPTLELVSRRLLPPDFSPGLGDLEGTPLTAGMLASLADAEAVRIETPPSLEEGGDLGRLLNIGSADGGDGLEFLISDGGTRWTRPDVNLSWRFAAPPLPAVPDAAAIRPAPPPSSAPVPETRMMPRRGVAAGAGPSSFPPTAPVPTAQPRTPTTAAGAGFLPTERLAPPPPGSASIEQRPTAAIPNLRDMVPGRQLDRSVLPQTEVDPFTPPAAGPALPPAAHPSAPADDPTAPLRTEKRGP
jgi:hypothetical protein